MEQLPHEIALSKAKIALMGRTDSAFFTTLAFSLIHEFSDKVKTAGTNGKKVMYNPEFFMALSHDERIFLILHEAMHCAYLHMERNGNRDQRKFNIAADHVINLQLIERGFKIPKDGLADDQYKGLSTEEVYNLLPESSSNAPMPGFGEDLQAPDDASPGAAEALANEIQDILVRASVQSKLNDDKPGTIPGEIQIFLDRLLNPKLPWNRILQKFLQSFSKNDYSFRKPNRRFFPQFHLPRLYGESLINIAVAVDTSGSVSDHEFNRFVTETHSILRMMKPEKITVLQFDTEIKSVHDVRNVQQLMNIQFTGRGGTQIEPVLEWANANKPQLLLVFSDGYFDFHGLETKVKTLWLIHDNEKFEAPFGKVIHYKVD
jgi:predicted metal-dependent peptidase